jgi:RNA polymerase sigma-70 factor (ECF subfamily)
MNETDSDDHSSTGTMIELAPEEDELVSRARAGDQRAFEELMRRSGTASKRLAVSIMRNVDDAEDALQDAYSKAWQHLPRFLGESKFSTWLNRIIVNQCLMRLRRADRRNTVPIAERSGEDEPNSVILRDGSPAPDAVLGRSELIEAVRREVRRMPRLLRESLELRDLHERPIEEVAASLSLSVPAVKSRLLRARAELRQRLLRSMTANPASSLPA